MLKYIYIYIEFLKKIVQKKLCKDCEEKFIFLKIEWLKIIEIIFGNHKSIVNYFSIFNKIYRIFQTKKKRIYEDWRILTFLINKLFEKNYFAIFRFDNLS